MSRIRADKLVNRAGSGGPHLPNGVASGFSVAGVVTATSFRGDGSQLSGISADSSSLVDSNSDTRVQATTSGATITGDATISGNLTVNGTTTTIDTAVTSVDSLAVDGDVGIGTTNPTSELSIFGLAPTIFLKDTLVGNSGVGSAYLRNDLTQSRFELGINGFRCIHCNTAGDVVLSFGNTGKFLTTSAGVRVVGDLEVDDVGIFKGGLVEKNVNAGTLSGVSGNCALSAGNVHRFTSAESGAQTVNFTGVHSTLTAPQSVSFTVIITPNNSGYINAVTIDGVTPVNNILWSGGSAPTSGSSSGKDVYTFTIFKYSGSTNDYEVYAAVTNYA